MAADRIVDVQHRTLVFDGKLQRDLKALLDGVQRRVTLDDIHGVLCDELLQKRRNVGKVIVESVAVDAAGIHNVLHRDLL